MEAAKSEVDAVLDCTVCTNTYRDPRVLNCGHHFCRECLERIAAANDKGHISCPTCRHITDTKVDDLAKITVIGDFRAKTSTFLEAKEPEAQDIYCSQCEPRKMAKRTCFECKLCFCEDCDASHQLTEKIFKHKVTRLYPQQFCSTHKNVFVLGICLDCDESFCSMCYPRHHGHDVAEVKVLADLARKLLLQKISNLEKEDNIEQSVKKVKTDLQNVQKLLPKLFEQINKQLAQLKIRVEELEKKCKEEVDKEAKELSIMTSDMQDFRSTKESLLRFIKDLNIDASDFEIVTKAKQYPKYASSSFMSLCEKKSYTTPDISKLEKLLEQLTIACDNCVVSFTCSKFEETSGNSASSGLSDTTAKDRKETLNKGKEKLSHSVTEKNTDFSLGKPPDGKETKARRTDKKNEAAGSSGMQASSNAGNKGKAKRASKKRGYLEKDPDWSQYYSYQPWYKSPRY